MLVSALLATLVSCDKSIDEPTDNPVRKIKASELFISSGNHQFNVTRASYNPKGELGYSIPDDGKYHVYYYIRIDNNIPGEDETNLPAGAYYPRTSANKTLVCDANHGLIWANAEWRQIKGFSKYIWSPDGSAIQSLIVEEPTIEALIKADQGHNTDGSKSNFAGLLAHQDELHFLWYACKKQDSDHVWHIDGILTSKDRTDISETAYGKEITDNYNGKGMTPDYGEVTRKGHVEIDIHQQKHKDWNEIKTSIHMRDTVSVEAFLPFGYQELADDFDIRVGEDYEYVTEILNSKIEIDGTIYNIEASIKHEPEGTRITVKPNKEALIAARKLYDDGITFEFHSYVSADIPTETIWEKIKSATYDTEGYTTIFGQITSAFHEDEEVKISK